MEEALKVFEQIKVSLPADGRQMDRVKLAENVVKAAIDIAEYAKAGNIDGIENRMTDFMLDQVGIFRESSAPAFPPGGIVSMGESINNQPESIIPGKPKQ